MRWVLPIARISETTRGRNGTAARPLPDMDVIENLVSAADPGGLATYLTLMAVFLGSVALARLRDDAMNIHEAHRADDSEQLDGAG